MANLNESCQDLHDEATRPATGQDELTTGLFELRALIQSLVSSGFAAGTRPVAGLRD